MICLVRLRALLDEICWPEGIGGFVDWTEYIGGFFAERGVFVNLLLVCGINGRIHGLTAINGCYRFLPALLQAINY